MKQCPNCQATSPAAKFCPKCGTAMVEMKSTGLTAAAPLNLLSKKNPKVLIIAACAIVFILVFIPLLLFVFIPDGKYKKALSEFANGNYVNASAELEKLPEGYKDTDELAPYYTAYATYESGEYQDAARQFETLGSYEDAADMASECQYLQASELAEQADYSGAAKLFKSLENYKDSAFRLEETKDFFIEIYSEYLTKRISALPLERDTGLSFQVSEQKLMDFDDNGVLDFAYWVESPADYYFRPPYEIAFCTIEKNKVVELLCGEDSSVGEGRNRVLAYVVLLNQETDERVISEFTVDEDIERYGLAFYTMTDGTLSETDQIFKDYDGNFFDSNGNDISQYEAEKMMLKYTELTDSQYSLLLGRDTGISGFY